MPKTVLTKCHIEVDAQDISTFCHSVAINSERDVHDVTGFQAENREKVVGLGDATIGLGVWQDFSAGAIDELLWPISKSELPVPIVVRPTADVVGPGNPEFAMQGLLANYSPLDGEVGEPSDIDVEFENGDPAGLTRATA